MVPLGGMRLSDNGGVYFTWLVGRLRLVSALGMGSSPDAHNPQLRELKPWPNRDFQISFGFYLFSHFDFDIQSRITEKESPIFTKLYLSHICRQ